MVAVVVPIQRALQIVPQQVAAEDSRILAGITCIRIEASPA